MSVRFKWSLFLIGITVSVEFIRQIADAQPTYELSRALLGSLDRERVKEEQLH